ncbi:MAG: 4Fe-4S dicluster domain-containing protein [Gammaproteobacteria bacterium]|nr:4Fe-4S dicluster domain-containing protein [Gammaproteobacteria bacterium]
MNAYITDLNQIESWFFKLAEKQPFFLPIKTEGINYRFEKLNDVRENNEQSFPELLSYKPTLLPPGKNIFPDGEILFSYYKDEQGHYQFTQGSNIESQIISGIRACDLKGIHLMDAVFSDGIKDIHYLQRREKTHIIAFNCMTPCDEHCFCEAAGSLDFQTGADIFITPLVEENKFLLEAQSSIGIELIKTLTASECLNPVELKEQALSSRPAPFGRQFVEPIEQVSKIIHQYDADKVYQQYAERCFSCGTCNLVCPTCYCFETKDEFELGNDLSQGRGTKSRHWDACLNPGFAEVAGGHNFRADPAARQRHRVRRKFDYLPQRFEQTFCTGCGRCGRQCTTDIDIFDIVNDVCSSVSETVAQELDK